MNTRSLLARAAFGFAATAAIAHSQDTAPDTAEAAPSPEAPAEERSEAPDEDLGEVFVTARKWAEEIGDVPQSVSAFRGKDLEQAGIDSVRDAALLVPNTNVIQFTARRLSFPVIRGIGSAQGEPAVTTYIDGVPQLSTASSNMPLYDLDRVEFLRGPQGTLFGRNSIGGVIQMITRDPADDPTVDLGVNFGNYNLKEFRASYSGPLGGDAWGGNFTGLQSSRDGYSTNTATGNRVDSRDAFYGRAQVIWQASEESRLRFGLHGESARDGAFALYDLESLRQTPNTVNFDYEGTVERDVISPTLTYEHFGGSLEFTSVTSFVGWDVDETADFDFTVVDGVRRSTTEEQDTMYQEFRLSNAKDGDIGGGWGLRWLAGLSGFASDSQRSAANEFRPGGVGIFFPPQAVGTQTQNGEFQDLAGAAFGQVAFIHDEKLELAAGLRLDYESKDASLSQSFDPGTGDIPLGSGDFSEDYSKPVPKLSAAYHFDETGQVYTYAAQGFQAGGFNLAAPDGAIAYDQESSWTWELGVKKSFADERVRLAAALFYIDWEDQQVSLFDPLTGGYIANVGASTSRGVELEAAGEITRGFDLFGSLGLNQTEIDQWTDPYGQDVSGNDLPFAPSSTWALGTQYRGDLGEDTGWYGRAEWVGVGDYYYDAGNRESESYQLVNLRLGVSWRSLELSGWVNNVFDERYVPVAFQQNPGDPSQFVGESAAPRTYGVSLKGSI